MRLIAVLAAVAASVFVAPALAQSIELAANPVPIVEVTVGNRPARLEVIPDFPGSVVLNRDSAQRLRVTTVPFPHGTFRLADGDGAVRMRLGTQRVSFGDVRGLRVMVSSNEVNEHADGVIGLRALPHRIVTFVLRAEPVGATDITLPLAENAMWPRIQIGEIESWVAVDFRREPTFFNRVVARRLDEAGRFTPVGELVQTPIVLGLSAMMQPVRADFTIAGLPIGTGAVRTDGPLLGLVDPEDVIVWGDAPVNREPQLVLGREALSRCSSFRIDRVARMLTLRCALPDQSTGQTNAAP